MKKRILIVLSVFISAILILIVVAYFSFWIQNENPRETQFVATDIDNFLLTLNSSSHGQIDASQLDAIYIQNGSKGLQAYLPGRIQNGTFLSSQVNKNWDHYASIREIPDQLGSIEQEIIGYLESFESLYPDAVFPPIYYVVGALNSGGSTSMDGIIIGIEMFARKDSISTDNFTEWQKQSVKKLDKLPVTVVHELVHIQQNRNLRNLFQQGNLLNSSIQEGAANFIAELITGEHLNEPAHVFGDAREEELWLEFKDCLKKEDYLEWFYRPRDGWPNDLGYWMGYKIVESFYRNSEDKSEAIREIINVSDYEDFLMKSKYLVE